MPDDAAWIYAEIATYMRLHGGVFADWYCGVTNDWQAQLFVEHRVNQAGRWISLPCESQSDARVVQQALIANLGCDGVPARRVDTGTRVYAYLKEAGVTDP